ncbi:hypothetical protein EW145_g889 [Phellinidium pouzarii]|uniref:Uncharacterized protein n=1 Tax=Phellinidium pouzarii TaxID=167371 RepID=A0A4S4LH40_9AGAM|nr:hypothetical protein EW145_g889 [Phellinidium pouzarii]
MRRAQSLRTHNARNSVTSFTDDLGMLKEQPEESVEDTLRKQLLATERENDKLQSQILALQDQLSQRPPIEQIQELEREYKHLELLLTGTQRENERCMSEMERGKNREKMLERELSRLAGGNWQTSLNIPSANNTAAGRSAFLRTGDTTSFFLPQAESTLAVDSTFDASSSSSFLNTSDSPSTPKPNSPPANAQTLNTAIAHIAQVRALILGMEERMQARENRLTQEVARAEGETRRLEAVRNEIDSIS